MRLREINNRDGHFKFNFNLKLNLKARQPLRVARLCTQRSASRAHWQATTVYYAAT